MKKSLLLFSLVFTGVASNAQTFTASPADLIESTYDAGEWISDYIYINNNSGSSLSLNFQTLTNTMDPLGWNVMLCTNDGCHTYVPSSGTLGTIAAADSGFLNIHVGFLGIAGTGQVRVRVYETGNPANSDTLTFRYHATVATAIFGAEKNNTPALSQNFPNPFSGFTAINYKLDTPDGKLIITDALGKNIAEYILNNSFGQVIFIESLKPGIYFYSLYNGQHKMISRNKMIAK